MAVIKQISFVLYELRCFDTVFRRPYPCFSIALRVILSLSDRYKIPPVIDYELKFVKMQFLRKIDIIYDNNKQKTMR